MIVKEKLQLEDLRKEGCFMVVRRTPIVILSHGTNPYPNRALNVTMPTLWKNGKKMKVPRLFALNQNVITKDLQLLDF